MSKRHFRKLGSTIRILWCLGCARMFGEYIHSVHNGQFDYAQYRWRSREWIIPTGPMDSQP